MNNLTTRKIVLGLLMALVLVFSVQGTADAQTVTRSSGDLQLTKPGGTFTIGFKVADVTDAVAQSVALAIPETVTLTKIGNAAPENSTTLATATGANRLYNGAYTFTFQASETTTAANITIGGTGFTVYIAPEHNDTSTIAADVDLDFLIGEKQIGGGGRDFSYTAPEGGITTHIRVTYTVSGSGSVYVKIDNRQGGGGKSLTTSSEAPVYLNMGGTTNKVTVSIVDQRADRAQSVTYIYATATLTKQSGHKQKGAESSRLANPLVVKVTDGKPKTVSGVQIDFTTKVAATNGTFLRDPNFPSDLYVLENDGTFAGKVKTNSSGLANVFWVLGTDASQTATATLVGTTDIQANPVDFTATLGTAASTASSIVKASGDGQRADEFNIIKDPLVVTVRDEIGQLLVNASVEFLARDGGTLNAPGIADPGSEAPSSQTYSGTPSRRVILTDSSGQASVRY